MSLGQLNIISVIFYYNIIVNSLLGGIFIYYTDVSNPVLDKVNNESRTLGLYLILYTMIAFPIGVLIAKLLFFRIGDVGFLQRYQSKPLIGLIPGHNKLTRLTLTGLTTVCFMALCYVTFSIGIVPQLSLLSHLSHEEILRIRVMNSRAFPGLLFIKTIFFEQLTPLLSLVAYACYRLTKAHYDRCIFILLFVMSIYVVTFSLSKSTLVVYLAFFLFMHIYMVGRIPVLRFFILSVALLILLIIMFFVITEQSVGDVVAYLVNRMFIDQVSGMYLMLQMFPDIYSFIGFDSLSSTISELIGNDMIQPSTRLAMEYAFPVAVAEGKMNLLSTLFIGEAWANFGWFGVILSPFYVGLITGVVYYYTMAKRKTPLLLAFITYCSFGTNFSSQLNLYLYNSVMLALIFILLAFYLISVGMGLLLMKHYPTSGR
ncbi:hypothetical protein Q5705_03680 [Kosakonia sp. H02]|nr:hypothetical protein Q5705_03680 [Kosakonia sp. H02]